LQLKNLAHWPGVGGQSGVRCWQSLTVAETPIWPGHCYTWIC